MNENNQPNLNLCHFVEISDLATIINLWLGCFSMNEKFNNYYVKQNSVFNDEIENYDISPEKY